MGRIIQNLDVQHRGQAAQALRADAECVDAPVDVQTQFLQRRLRTARNEIAHIDGIHQRFLGEQHGLLGAAADPDAQHSRRAPARAHLGHHFQNPIGHGIGRIQHGEQGFVFGTAALRGDGDLELIARSEFRVDDGGCVVLGVAALECGIRDDGGPQLVVRIQIGAAHPFVDHRLKIEPGVPGHAHAHLDEHHHDAGVLADRPVALCAHARVGENLRDGIARRGTLFDLVRAAHGADEIRRVVIGNVLQGVRNAGNEIGFANDRHSFSR